MDVFTPHLAHFAALRNQFRAAAHKGPRVRKIYHTPHGDLSEQHEHTVDDTWREVEFAVPPGMSP